MTSHEPIFPNPDVLNQQEYGKFVLANLAARRARQIRDGAPPLVRIESSHPLSIALAEIAAGKIKPIMGALDPVAGEIDEFASLDTAIETEGLLLPGIEEDEGLAVALGLGDLDDHDLEPDDLDEDEVGSITDLLDEDLPVENVEDEEGDISLDDLAEKEDSEDDADAAEEV